MSEKKKNDIDELKEFIDLAKTLEITDREKYPPMRLEFNVRVISSLLGIEFDRLEDGSFEITAVKDVPSSDDIFKIMALVNEYMDEVEDKFLPGGTRCNVIQIPEDETITDKVFCEAVFGHLTKPLSERDFLKIGQLGTMLRKYRKRRRNLIIGGIAVGTVILVVGGVFYMHRSK